METKKPLSYFLDLIQLPIAICDGRSRRFDLEYRMQEFFESRKIPFEYVSHLYDFPERHDLSKYKTISFHTTEEWLTQEIKKILDFDKSNLRCVIVENRKAFGLIKEEAKTLGIPVIGFDRAWEMAFLTGFYPPDEEFEHPFFDPWKEQIDSSTW